jgi:RNA-binding protein
MLNPVAKKYLKGMAHGLKPVVFIGQKGLTENFEKALQEALDTHELIKVRFVDFKEKDQKTDLSEEIEKRCGCEKVGMVGHIAIFYRRHKNPEKRKIVLPES